MGLLCPYLVVVYFDADGRFLSVEDVELTKPPLQQGTTRIYYENNDGSITEVPTSKPLIYITHTAEFRESLDRDIRKWRRKFGFVRQPIDVQEFFLEDRYLGIRLLPEYLEEFKTAPMSVAQDEEDATEYQEILDRWQSSGNFVLWWGNDHWLNADGEVEST